MNPVQRLSPLIVASAAASLLGACVVAPPAPYAGPVMAPPAPQVEVIGAVPGPGCFWVGGWWKWVGGRYAWSPGYWETYRPGYRWAPHQWARNGAVWTAHAGHWQPR